VTKLPDSLLDRLDITASTEAEINATQNLLPTQPIDLAARDELATTVKWVEAKAHSDQEFQPAHVISAYKWRFGRRPVSALPLYERVLYRSLVALLSDGLAQDRNDEDYKEFGNAPTDAGAEYVVLTDISNYYATIDVDRLCRSLLSRTGEWQVVDQLNIFLKATSGGFGGIPQSVSTSDRLGDTLGDVLLERLLRAGLNAWRFADDFRFATASRNDAVAALEIFDREARALGLSVNERKTYIMGQARYQQMMDAPNVAFSEAWDEARDRLTIVGPYGFEFEVPDVDEVMQEAALSELREWSNSGEDGEALSEISRPDLSVILQILGQSRNAGGLEYIFKLLQNEPQHTPIICRYLREIAQLYPSAAYEHIEVAVTSLPLSKWQTIWLLDAIVRVFDPDTWEWHKLGSLIPWARDQAASDDVIVASQAILTLGKHKLLTLAEWNSPATDLSDYAEPFRLAALSGLAPDEPRVDADKSLLGQIMRPWGDKVMR
jgi:hypothetical protein